MLVEQQEKLQHLVQYIDRVCVDPDVEVDYFIPGFKVTTGMDEREVGGPYVQFTYIKDGVERHIQHTPLTHGYMEKSAQDLANLMTFSLERFMEEIDSRQYGAQ